VSHVEITSLATADSGLYVVVGGADGSVVTLVIADPEDSEPADQLLHSLPNRQLDDDDDDDTQSKSISAVSGLFTAIATRRLHTAVTPPTVPST